MKNVTKLMALVMALIMALGLVPAMAEEAAPAPNAYIMFANSDWSTQYWLDGNDYAGVTPTNAVVTGEGDYTVGLTFDSASEGVAFMALGLKNGEIDFPKHYLKINEIRINGAAIEVGKGYTSSDDTIETRMNIMNEWVGELPADARSFDGNVADDNWVIVDKDAFTGVTSIEIDFSLLKYGIDTAYIMFADQNWAAQYWLDGNDYGGVTVNNATVTGAGDYSVGLDFTTTEAGKATGVAFTALGIKHGENLFPGMTIKINDIRINGESIAFTKGASGVTVDAEEIAADVLLRIWDTIPPENPPSLKNYAAMIARSLAINRYRAAHARKRGDAVPLDELGDSLGMADDTADRITAAELSEAIGAFLERQDAADRALFERRYIQCEEITAIADEWGISAGSARIRLWRMRQKLRRYLERRHFL